MEFVHGTYTEATIKYALEKTIKDFDIYVSSYNTSNVRWIADDLNYMLLALFAHLTKKTFQFYHRKISIKDSDVDSFNKPYSNMCSPQYDKDYKINVWHIVNGFTKIREITGYEDIEAAAYILKYDDKHIIRVIKTSTDEVHILTSKYDWDLIRKIIALIPKIFTEIETPELTPALIKLGSGCLDEAYEIIDEIYKASKFEETFLINKFNTLKKGLTENKIKSIKDSIERERNKISQYEEAISAMYENILDFSKTLFALENTNSDYIEEYLDYLVHNKTITVLNVTDKSITLDIVAPIRYFDSDVMRKYFESNASFIQNNPFNKWLMEKLFISCEIQLYTQVNVILSFDRPDVCRDSYADYMNYIPHPHLARFNCWGNNKALIVRAISECDYIGATEQIIASAFNLNLLDLTVVTELLHTFTVRPYNTAKSFKIKSTGEFKSYVELKEVYANETNNAHTD